MCGAGKQSGDNCAMHESSSKHSAAAKTGRVAEIGKLPADIFKPYFGMRNLLASDKVKGVDKLSASLVKESNKLEKSLVKAKAPSEQLDALKEIESAAAAMKTDNLSSARESFGPLSRSVLAYVKDYGSDVGAYSFYCDMAKESWLQESTNKGNPYYGSQMLKCGALSGHIEKGQYVSN